MDPSLSASSQDENCLREIFIEGGGEKYWAVDVDYADDARALAEDDIMEVGGAREWMESSSSLTSLSFLYLLVIVGGGAEVQASLSSLSSPLRSFAKSLVSLLERDFRSPGCGCCQAKREFENLKFERS